MFSNVFKPSESKENDQLIPLDEITYEDAMPIVKKTWKELMKNEHEVGEKIYEYVLTKEISMSVLFINSQIEQQSILFMKMLDIVVGYLDDPKTMNEKLLQLGEIHNKKYKIKPKHYKHFRAAFMKAIKNYIPWNERRENSWLWFWNLVITAMLASSKKKEQIIPLDVSSEKVLEYVLAIQESFGSAMESPVEFGNSFYAALLEQQSGLATLFSKTAFSFQSARFIAMLQHAVRLLDDQSTFQNKILSLSYQHQQYGVKIDQLQAFADVFVQTLKSINSKKNNKWKPIHDESWNWFWKIVIKLFRMGLEEDSNEIKNQLYVWHSHSNSVEINTNLANNIIPNHVRNESNISNLTPETTNK